MADLVDLLNAPTAIVGTTGAGKTFAAKGAVEELLRLGRRVVIIDPTGAWYGLRSGVDGDKAGGFPVMIFGGDHADIEITDKSGGAIAEAIAGREVQAIVDTSEMTGGEKTRFLTDFLQVLYAKNKAALHLVVDEADEICPQNPMPDERVLSGAFDKIVRRGRIKGFRPLMITQRPAVLHKNVLSQIGTLVALKLTSPQDRKAIEDWVKGNADADQAKAVMLSLPGLSRGDGWVWSPAAGVLERRSFPAITTFDSSRTPDAGKAVVEPALSAVDVEGLRAAMVQAEPKSAGRTGKSGASKADLAGAEKRGYDRGFADGRKTGWAEAMREAGRLVAAFAGSFTVGEHAVVDTTAAAQAPAKQKSSAAARSHIAPRAASETSPGHRKAGATLLSAIERYPEGISWADAAIVAGMMSGNGYFYGGKKYLTTEQLVEERGNLVLSKSLNGSPATLAEIVGIWAAKLKKPGNQMLEYIATEGSVAPSDLSDALGIKTGNGYWYGGVKAMRAAGLIVDDKNLISLSPLLARAPR